MGYCSTQWISDYTWSAVMNYRGPAPALASMIGGRADDARGVRARCAAASCACEPAMRVVTRPAVPSRPGRYRLELRDRTGRVLTGFTFDPEVDRPRRRRAGLRLRRAAHARRGGARWRRWPSSAAANGVVEQTARDSARQRRRRWWCAADPAHRRRRRHAGDRSVARAGPERHAQPRHVGPSHLAARRSCGTPRRGRAVVRAHLGRCLRARRRAGPDHLLRRRAVRHPGAGDAIGDREGFRSGRPRSRRVQLSCIPARSVAFRFAVGSPTTT